MSGEICVKPRFEFMGYYKNPKLTAKAIDSEAYFITGDIGYFDDDGYLNIVDRIKNMIYQRGLRILPSDIERLTLSFIKITRY